MEIEQLAVMEKTASQRNVSCFDSFSVEKTVISDWLDLNKDNFGIPPHSTSKTLGVTDEISSSAQADCKLHPDAVKPFYGKHFDMKPKATLIFDPSKTFTTDNQQRQSIL